MWILPSIEEVFQTAKWVQTSLQPSVSSEELGFYIECTAQKIVQSEKVETVSTFVQKHGTWRKQRATPLGWEDESVLSSKANPGCILSETGCAQEHCVFGFGYSSLQTHRQLPANTVPHPRCTSTVCLPPVIWAQEPQPVIYYLAVFCLTWVHTTTRVVALSQAALPYLWFCIKCYLWCGISSAFIRGCPNLVLPQLCSPAMSKVTRDEAELCSASYCWDNVLQLWGSEVSHMLWLAQPKNGHQS